MSIEEIAGNNSLYSGERNFIVKPRNIIRGTKRRKQDTTFVENEILTLLGKCKIQVKQYIVEKNFTYWSCYDKPTHNV